MRKIISILFACFSFVTIFALGSCKSDHNVSTAWESDDTNHWHTCSDCDNKHNLEAHSYGEWIVTTPATETVVGSKKQTCTVCGYDNIEVIPVLNHTHTYGEWQSNETNHWKECACGEKSEEAAHTLTNGVCTVCMFGCQHENTTEEVIEPTCTEKGYTNVICSDCGHITKTDEVDALGHQGTLTCDFCNISLVPEGYFDNLVASLLNPNFAIIIPNFTISAEIGTIDFLELSVSLDENNELKALGKVEFTDPSSQQQEGFCILEGNMLYLIADAQDQLFVVLNLNDFDHSFFGSLPQILGQVYDMLNFYETEVMPVLQKFLSENGFVNKVLFRIIDELVTVTKTNDSYTFAIDYDTIFGGISELNNILSTFTIEDVLDMVVGEGSYTKIALIIEMIFGSTVGDLNSFLTANNLSLDKIVSVINFVLPIISNGMFTSVDKIFNMPEGYLVNYLMSTEVQNTTIPKIIEDLTGLDISAYKTIILTFASSMMKANVYVTIYHLLFSPSETVEGVTGETIRDQINSYIEMAKKLFVPSFVTDTQGNLLNYTFDVNAQWEDKDVNIQLVVDYNYKSLVDYDSLKESIIEETSQTEITAEKLETIFDTVEEQADGSYEITKVYTDPDKTITSVYNVKNFNNFIITFECDPWVCIEIYANGTTKVEIGSFVDIETENKMTFYYNLETGTLSIDEIEHNMVENESKSILAEGCTGIGYKCFECSVCGYTLFEKYTNGHNFDEGVYDLNQSSCEYGLIKHVTCADCGYEEDQEIYEHVELVLQQYSLEELGEAGCVFEVRGCLCGYLTPTVDVQGSSEAVRVSHNVIGSETIDEWDHMYSSGLIIRQKSRIEVYGCEEWHTDTYYINYKSDNSFDKEIKLKPYLQYKHELIEDVELINGDSCTGGVLYTEHCKNCDYIEEEHTFYEHYEIVKETIVFSDYGFTCDAIVQVSGCACGFTVSSEEDSSCIFEQDEPIMVEIEGVEYERIKYTCSDTENYFTIDSCTVIGDSDEVILESYIRLFDSTGIEFYSTLIGCQTD